MYRLIYIYINHVVVIYCHVIMIIVTIIIIIKIYAHCNEQFLMNFNSAFMLIDADNTPLKDPCVG